MSIATHDTAPTQFVETNGIRFSYRRFGKKGEAPPVIFNQHFRGTMDYWDPAVTDGLAQSREVVLFNNAGVASSSGQVPTSFPEMGRNAIAFIQDQATDEVFLSWATGAASFLPRLSRRMHRLIPRRTAQFISLRTTASVRFA